MISQTYLFGPFIGDVRYELNYFVGHAIYLRKQNPANKIMVLTRREHFDLYGKYATMLLPLPLSEELITDGFDCTNMRPLAFDEILKKLQMKFRNKTKIHDHFYPKLGTFIKKVKWYYPRDEIDFDFKPRPKNKKIALEIIASFDKLIISDYHKDFKKWNKYQILPFNYFTDKLNLKKTTDATMLGVLIEVIRLSKYTYADIDSILGRLAMLTCKPLITQRDYIDAQYLNPINPYGSLVIGCQKLEDGIEYFGGFHANNI